MVDVAFLLIVFFALAFNFSVADQNERVKLPVSELARPPEEPPPHLVTLHILPNGDVIYDNIERSLAGLHAPLQHQIAVLKYLNVPADKVTGIIRADAQCEFRHVHDVIELCQGLGLEKFTLRTRRQEE